MARYIGPKSRIARKFGEAIFGPDKVLSKKNYPPGQHGQSRRKKTSEYGIQLREKKKPNILMAYWKNNSVTFTKKLRVILV
jgi:small subunit ribosomal protein S4